MRARHKSVATVATITGIALALTACSEDGSTRPPDSSPSPAVRQSRTEPGTKPLDTLTWYGDYRPVYTLDPIKVADYPEETILPNVCTSLLQMTPGYDLKPSLASAWKQTTPTTLVFTIRTGVRFSDGSPVTAEDVAYSLTRNTIPENASSFAGIYAKVAMIAATGPNQVTVTFSSPDTTFANAMATMAGAIVSKKYAEAKGQEFGTPGVGVVCAGPYTVSSYDGTHDLTLAANPGYWDAAHQPKATKVRFVFPTDPTALANAIADGTIQGAFNVPPSIIGPLRDSAAGQLLIGGVGSSPQNADIIPTNVTSGPLSDKLVRQVLSLAIDREALAQKVWAGAAQPLFAVAGPGLFGPNKDAYQPAYDKLVTATDVDKAKTLVTEAKAGGTAIRLAYPSELDYGTTIATYVQQVGNQIGLKVELVGQPSAQYGNLFVDAGARAKVDAFLTVNYVEFPSPAAMIQSYATRDGFQNYEGYDNPHLDALIDQAYAATDPAQQAASVSQAQAILAEDLPWIPLLNPNQTLFLANGITGAPLTFSFMSSPWLTEVGGS